MSTRALLIVTALLEMGTGVALLIVPSLTAELLLGEGLSQAPAHVVARVAGAALTSVAVACWLARNAEHGVQSCLVAGILIYNVAVPVLLIHGWIALSLHGLGLWPATLLHTALAVWCIACLRPSR